VATNKRLQKKLQKMINIPILKRGPNKSYKTAKSLAACVIIIIIIIPVRAAGLFTRYRC
jgi:hypothetical protein